MKTEFPVFRAADILLPDFEKTDGGKWAVVACDQFTSEPEYWARVEKTVGDAPSALRLILPEAYLAESETRVPQINEAMKAARRDVLKVYPDAMIYLERTQSDGSIRKGIIGAVDLEQYDYKKGANSLIRATEGTVLERIPPRVKIRNGAELELPHVMLLIDDPDKRVIEPLTDATKNRAPLYDFDLMEGGGHVRAQLLTGKEQATVTDALAGLVTEREMEKKYGFSMLPPLLFAVGDGNHSLAAAKATYEAIKAEIGEEAAKNHPARYALAEIVNLHDEALKFEPIYRVVFGAKRDDLLGDLCEYAAGLHGNAAAQETICVTAHSETVLRIPEPEQQLTVGTLQAFLDGYLKKHPSVKVDYIHGEGSVRELVKAPATVGFLFDGMRKDELFKTVIFDGALPRKTFSMGHAQDKRYYIEARVIK